MTTRATFSRIMNIKAQQLVDSCRATTDTNPDDVREYSYPTHILKRLSRAKYSIDIKKTQSQQDAFYDIIAELDEEANIVNRDDKIPNIKTMNIYPNDIHIRLQNSNAKFGAVQDLALVDQFILAFIASNSVSTIAPDNNMDNPYSTTLLLSDISLQKIEEAKQRLRTHRNQISYYKCHSNDQESR